MLRQNDLCSPALISVDNDGTAQIDGSLFIILGYYSHCKTAVRRVLGDVEQFLLLVGYYEALVAVYHHRVVDHEAGLL